jgi:integral membrane protein (TIGR01906 family)
VAGPLAIWAIARSRRRAARALLRGSWVTIGLLLAVGVYMTLSWQSFFTRFHQIFFDSGTWLFDYSDTLIRLFPIRFWIAVALAIVALLFVQATLLAATVWGLWLRQPISR